MRKLKTAELGRMSIEEYRHADKHPVVVVLDNVRSLYNVGSVFRTSDAFLVEKLLLCGVTGTPPHRDINKTAIGAQETVTWEHHKDILELLKKLKEEGYSLIAIEQTEGSISLEEYRPKTGEKLAIIFGNEVEGVQQSAIDLCDAVIEIPQYGMKHSLNISVSVGVVLYDLVRKLTMNN